jgi:phosphoglycolate phosphatase-like HAD superfamily hydrolase
MHLLVFDIDGTLIHSHALEADCFIQAFSKVTGINNIDRDWLSYTHVTDVGIASESIEKHLQKIATQEELQAIEETFITLFQKVIVDYPPTPILGAESFIQSFMQNKNIALAIATGSYYRSAMLKLNLAKLMVNHLPLATCNDSLARMKIMQFAESKAKKHYQVTHFESITYFGDGPWDAVASKNLQWQFIGISSHYSKELLYQWGAKVVLEDYAECFNLF